MISVYCDGSIDTAGGREKGGVRAAFGFVVYDYKCDSKISCYGTVPVGDGTTVNTAEYFAIIRALEMLQSMDTGHRPVVIYSDSQLVIRQINGVYAVREAHLQKLSDRVRNLKRGFVNLTFTWVPRTKNTEADALAKRAWEGKADGSKEDEEDAA